MEVRSDCYKDVHFPYRLFRQLRSRLEIPDVGIANPQDDDGPTVTSLGWIRVEAQRISRPGASEAHTSLD
jgi:hypothetical protein